MAQQTINVGSANNDGTGDPLRVAMTKVQNNFSEIYGAFSTNGTISLASTSANVANVQISNSGLSLYSNSTVNSVVNSTTVFISNSTSSANLTPLGVKVGANVIVNSVSLFVGNSTIYSNVAAADSTFTGNVIFSNTVSFSGNVGVGNTAPNAKLQVTGTANISGAVALGSTLSVSTNTVTMGSSNVGAVNFANGYSRLPNGLLMQWGLMSVNTTTGAQTFSTVTGTSFTNIFSMSATSNSTAALVGITVLSATGFTMISNTTANVAVYWSAIGK